MCIHRRKLSQPCQSCDRLCDQMDAAFARDVFFGKFNERGYTEAEWKASRFRGDPWR